MFVTHQEEQAILDKAIEQTAGILLSAVVKCDVKSINWMFNIAESGRSYVINVTLVENEATEYWVEKTGKMISLKND